MAARRPFWKWHRWKSIGFCLWPPSTCIWNLKLKFQSKLDLCSGNHVVYRQTDRRTDGRTRWIQYTPPPTSLGGGIITLWYNQLRRQRVNTYHGKYNLVWDFVVITVAFLDLWLASSEMCADEAHWRAVVCETYRNATLVSRSSTETSFHHVHGNVSEFGKIKMGIITSHSSDAIDKVQHIEAETKWQPFRKQHFQVHFV